MNSAPSGSSVRFFGVLVLALGVCLSSTALAESSQAPRTVAPVAEPTATEAIPAPAAGPIAREPSADDPPGVVTLEHLDPFADLAATLSRDRSWLTAEVVQVLGAMSLRIDEVFTAAPRYIEHEGRLYEIKLDRVGELWTGFDAATDPFFVYLTHEVFTGLGEDRALGYQDGTERVIVSEDFEHLPALGITLHAIPSKARLAQPAVTVGLGGPFDLGTPQLMTQRGSPPSQVHDALTGVTSAATSCAHEAPITSCSSSGAPLCGSGSDPYFVLKNLKIHADHEGLFKGNPEVELFPLNSDAFAATPAERPTTNIQFHGQYTTDCAGRSRFLPDVNNKNVWYSTDGVALFPYSLANVWVGALWENDGTRGVLDTTESTSVTIKTFATPQSATFQTFQLVDLGFFENLALVLKNLLAGDGDDSFNYPMAITNVLACSSGLGASAPPLLTLSAQEWEVQGYFACIDPSCAPPSVSISGPTFFLGSISDTWTANVTGSVPPFSYRWTKNGVFIGTGSSISTSSSSSFTLEVTVTDSVGQTTSGTLFVQAEPTCGDVFC